MATIYHYCVVLCFRKRSGHAVFEEVQSREMQLLKKNRTQYFPVFGLLMLLQAGWLKNNDSVFSCFLIDRMVLFFDFLDFPQSVLQKLEAVLFVKTVVLSSQLFLTVLPVLYEERVGIDITAPYIHIVAENALLLFEEIFLVLTDGP